MKNLHVIGSLGPVVLFALLQSCAPLSGESVQVSFKFDHKDGVTSSALNAATAGSYCYAVHVTAPDGDPRVNRRTLPEICTAGGTDNLGIFAGLVPYGGSIELEVPSKRLRFDVLAMSKSNPYVPADCSGKVTVEPFVGEDGRNDRARLFINGVEVPEESDSSEVFLVGHAIQNVSPTNSVVSLAMQDEPYPSYSCNENNGDDMIHAFPHMNNNDEIIASMDPLFLRAYCPGGSSTMKLTMNGSTHTVGCTNGYAEFHNIDLPGTPAPNTEFPLTLSALKADAVTEVMARSGKYIYRPNASYQPLFNENPAQYATDNLTAGISNQMATVKIHGIEKSGSSGKLFMTTDLSVNTHYVHSYETTIRAGYNHWEYISGMGHLGANTLFAGFIAQVGGAFKTVFAGDLFDLTFHVGDNAYSSYSGAYFSGVPSYKWAGDVSGAAAFAGTSAGSVVAKYSAPGLASLHSAGRAITSFPDDVAEVRIDNKVGQAAYIGVRSLPGSGNGQLGFISCQTIAQCNDDGASASLTFSTMAAQPFGGFDFVRHGPGGRRYAVGVAKVSTQAVPYVIDLAAVMPANGTQINLDLTYVNGSNIIQGTFRPTWNVGDSGDIKFVQALNNVNGDKLYEGRQLIAGGVDRSDGTQRAVLYRSPDGGRNWYRVYLDDASGPHLSAIVSGAPVEQQYFHSEHNMMKPDFGFMVVNRYCTNGSSCTGSHWALNVLGEQSHGF